MVDVLGVEGEAQQTALAATGDEASQVEEGRGLNLGTIEDANPARLLGEKKTPGAIPGLSHGNDTVQTARHRSQRDRGSRRGSRPWGSGRREKEEGKRRPGNRTGTEHALESHRFPASCV